MNRFNKHFLQGYRMRRLGLVMAAAASFSGLLFCYPVSAQTANSRLPLKSWEIQSHAKVDANGETISTPSFQPRGWYPATVPSTVTAALVANKVYPDPYFGMNLRSFPGVSYPIGSNFSNLPMPPESPFITPWWYRTEFRVPADYQGKTIWLNFRGLNYRANVWLNGKQIAKSDETAGAWRTWEFDVTRNVQPGKENVLAVQVFSPTENDLAITFVDWNPSPPDKNMGLWREVYLTTSGPVALRHAAVIPDLNSPANDRAALTVTADLRNASDKPVKGTLKGRIEKVAFEQEVELAAGESKEVVFEPEKFSQLNFVSPRVWWPAQMGEQNLYPLEMEFAVDGRISDRSASHFGIRKAESKMDDKKHLAFLFNGKAILVRGGGWSSDMMLRENPQKMEDEIRYTKDMGLNTIRLEGKLETEEFFELTDRLGMLVMAGWCCCDHWEHWQNWKDADYPIAQESLRDQMRRLRGHPSLLMWLNGSDNPPPPDVEQMYLGVLKQCRWPNPAVSSATQKIAGFTGDSGVKMTGPYEYIAPSYWLEEKEKRGGAWGFNTETSPGPAVPPIESLREMLPKEHLWPIDDWWNFHAGGGEFKTIDVYRQAQDARYGASQSAEEFAGKSQVMNYEGIRAMFEAFNRNKYQSTGVIQWMLNNAWPSMIWHLYDYYMRPGGGYFGAKIANETLHPMYSYDDRSVWVVSSQYKDAKGLLLTTRVLNLDMTEKFSQKSTLDAAADSTNHVLALPEIVGLTPTYFVVLTLQDGTGKQVGSNFYWLSSKPETLDWEKSTWYMTPTGSFADYTALSTLPKVKLKSVSRTERKGEDMLTHVTVENPSKSLAFFIRLKLNKGAGGQEVLPVVWEDNYFSLLPGEKREVTAQYRARELGSAKADVSISGWNVEP
jgi:exo-1,4-beta-D-glucosaminidase